MEHTEKSLQGAIGKIKPELFQSQKNLILDTEYFDSFEVIKAGFMAIEAVDPTML